MRLFPLSIGLAIGCWSIPSSPTPAVSAAPPRTFYAPSDPFAVAMHMQDAAWTNATFSLCPISGKTFVCGMQRLLVVDGTEIHEVPGLAAGLPPDRQIELVAGTWPSDAWLVARADTAYCYRCEFIAYRWRVDPRSASPSGDAARPGRAGAFDGWREVERFTTLPSVRAVPWRDHLVVLDYDDLSKTPPTRKLTVLGTPRVTLPHPVDGCDTPWALDAIAATPDTFFASWSSCGLRTGMERWSDFDKPGRFEIVDPSTSDVALAVLGPREVVAYGMRYGDRSPFMLRFDGARWQPHESPAKPGSLGDDDVFAIESYARSPDGIEWAVVDTNNGELWARPPKKAWQRVETWRTPTRRLGERPWLRRMWLAEGSVWLWMFAQTNCQGAQGCQVRDALLRTGLPASARSFPYTP